MSIDEWMMLLETALEADGRHHDVERGFRMAFTMSQAFVVDEVAGVDHMTMEQPEFYEAVRVWAWLVVFNRARRSAKLYLCHCALLQQLARVALLLGHNNMDQPLCLWLEHLVLNKVILLADVRPSKADEDEEGGVTSPTARNGGRRRSSVMRRSSTSGRRRSLVGSHGGRRRSVTRGEGGSRRRRSSVARPGSTGVAVTAAAGRRGSTVGRPPSGAGRRGSTVGRPPSGLGRRASSVASGRTGTGQSRRRGSTAGSAAGGL